jgi:hypothetical protein
VNIYIFFSTEVLLSTIKKLITLKIAIINCIYYYQLDNEFIFEEKLAPKTQLLENEDYEDSVRCLPYFPIYSVGCRNTRPLYDKYLQIFVFSHFKAFILSCLQYILVNIFCGSKSCYDIIGVSKNATLKEIKKVLAITFLYINYHLLINNKKKSRIENYH